MLKNVYEAACFKWWDFPQINDGFWYSVSTPDDLGTYYLLSMHKPGGASSSLGDYEVDIVENFEGFSDDQIELLEKHFGVALYRLE